MAIDAQFVEIQRVNNMSFNPKHLRELVVKPALEEIGLWSLAAEELIMLTVAVESEFGTFLRQNGSEGGFSVGRGITSVEPETFKWLKMVFSHLIPENATIDDLVTDLKLAVKVARLRYRVVKEALPQETAIKELAKYWKKYYNASPNGASADEAMKKYKKFVLKN